MRHLVICGRISQKQFEISDTVGRYIVSEPEIYARDSEGPWTCLLSAHPLDAMSQLSLLVHADGRVGALWSPEVSESLAHGLEDHLVGIPFTVPRQIRRTSACGSPSLFERIPLSFQEVCTSQDLEENSRHIHGEIAGDETDEMSSMQGSGEFDANYDALTQRVSTLSATERIELRFFDQDPFLIMTRTTKIVVRAR